jgi:hypothetical protein
LSRCKSLSAVRAAAGALGGMQKPERVLAVLVFIG